MLNLPPTSLLLLCALSIAPLAACSQGQGGACQLNSDCDDGLVCLRARGSERGTCEDPDDIGQQLPDAGAGDAAQPPLPPDEDAGTEPDTEDAGG